ncbi:hypothetical protein [Streptomyces sp. NBC_01207]|uniref:hypothetical protein n=1 Tax=Streptomyces sp. NBC_01207 TaxID=2903772 RepID=UPI002E14BB8D|nr:hypothetical protein OG457_27130 [Streptomyces sp. NBC_01207]
MHEPFGPEYVRPKPAACPDCQCCTAALCERGRSSVMECLGLTADHRDVVRGCPCSGELTAGTASWRIGRLRAARRATEQPFPRDVEAVLRAAAAHFPVDPEAPETIGLVGLHFLAPGTDDGALVLTEFGRVYLMTLDHPRYLSPLRVVAVDEDARTAQVLVEAWSTVTAVTVPADQLLSALGGGAVSSLPGVRLMCSTNTWADTPDDVVVTAVQVPPVVEPSPVPPPPPSAAAVAVPPSALAPAPVAVVDATVELPIVQAGPAVPPAAPVPSPTSGGQAPPMPNLPPPMAGGPGVLPLSGQFFRVDQPEAPRG